MTEKTSGIGPILPPEIPKEDLEKSKPNIEGLMHAKFGTLGQMKAALIHYLGEKEGLKFYNLTLETIARASLQQIQQSAQQAKKAAQKMRDDQDQ